jgi:pimeloyl-ACP methyl ester carboxylesterase
MPHTATADPFAQSDSALLERVRTTGSFEYIDEGSGQPILLLHGLFGALSNWADVLTHYSKQYRVLIPLLPIYTGGQEVEPSVEGIGDYVMRFVARLGLKNIHVVGNSLGGHVALVFALTQPHLIRTLTLTGSSGLFEEGMGSGFPRRGDYQYVSNRVAYTFYNPLTASKALVDEVFGIVNNAEKALRVLKIARAAQRMNLRESLKIISIPSLLIWGLNDNITPAYVAHEFNRLLEHSELHFIDKCGHAAMMEQPERFLSLLDDFLIRHS